MLSLFWGFISTMWYVKRSWNAKTRPSWNSFISTMWYVKILIVLVSCMLISLFYINYVVCKDKSYYYNLM
ncbi:TPA: potassium transporter [Clostridioides difficile]